MVNSENPVYPYPQRPSELVKRPDYLFDIKQIPLTDEQRGQLSEYESGLYEKLREAKKIAVSTHTIYPGAFLTPTGQRLFQALYLNPENIAQIKGLVDSAKTSQEDIKKDKLYEAYFDDLVTVSSSENSFQTYCQSGVVLEKTTAVLSELGVTIGQPVVLIGKSSAGGELDKHKIEQVLTTIDLNQIPKSLRERANDYSSSWASEQFKHNFASASGDVNAISDPERFTVLVDPEKLKEKVVTLRHFKNLIKQEIENTSHQNGELTEAKRVILSLYLRYINVKLAGLYSDMSVAQNTGKQDGSKPKITPRTLERIDHFIEGVDPHLGHDGLYETIPLNLIDYGENKELEIVGSESNEYDAVMVDANSARQLSDIILKLYGLDTGNKAWSSVIRKSGKSSLTVDTAKNEIRISKDYNRSVTATLVVLAHEIEGHIFRHINRESGLLKGIKLLDELSSGRGDILSEAAAMYIESETSQKISGKKRNPNKYYCLALYRKSQGGSFKDCFHTFFKEYVKNHGKTVEEAVHATDFYNEAFSYVYGRILRIFRGHTPLSDNSTYITTSDQVKYLEQEIVVAELKKRGLDGILYVAGPDLHSMSDLIKLGCLDLSKISKPKMLVAEKLWPEIKKRMDGGMDIKEAIKSITLDNNVN